MAPSAFGATTAREAPAAIRDAIEATLRPRLDGLKSAEVEIAVDAIDPRLQFPECPSLTVTLPADNLATMAAKVACDSPAWSLYVPVHLHAWVEAVVAAANLAPNRALSPRDLTLGRVDMFAGRNGILTDPRQVEGKILRAGLQMGSPILSPLLDLPVTVHRGQKIVMTLTDPTMTIKTTGLALEDGRVGDNIEVQNPDSRKTFRATVASDGGVELKF
ncbi:MAG TPA: flagellar basal body P-ring formation chaperone FlgA [Stellaceae bacterium]